MEECEYCSESFDGEDAYLDHLADSHGDELGAIDQRRVDSRGSDDESGLPLGTVVVGLVVVLAVGVAIYVTQLGGDGVSPDGIEAADLDSSGETERLSAVEQFDSEGTQHVEAGSSIDYARTPPLSGPHYNIPTEGGFYEEPQPYGNLIHALEHGAVVIYYDSEASGDAAGTSDTAKESLEEFAATHTGQWRSVIVVPNPEDDPEADYVVTAWQNRLYMDSYDAQTVHAFLSEFLGRGPENPVR